MGREEIDKLLYRIRRCELYIKGWGLPTTIQCKRPEGKRVHGILACEECRYLPKEDDLAVASYNSRNFPDNRC